jgi:hypothetical protein
MIAVMPTAVVAVLPTTLTNAPATMPGVPAAATTVPTLSAAVRTLSAAVTLPAAVTTLPATGVSLASHGHARERDCHAADQARKFHKQMSHSEGQAQPPRWRFGMREVTVRLGDSMFPNPHRHMESAPCLPRSEVIYGFPSSLDSGAFIDLRD